MENEHNLIKDFNTFAQAKKQTAIMSKLVLLFALVVIVLVLIWGFMISTQALNKVVVVEKSGEYLKTSAESNEKLFITLIKSTCGQLTYYANSFDRLDIKENQARAMFLCNKNDIERVFTFYNTQKSYLEALELGAVYKCDLLKVHEISGNEEPYNVRFSSVLTVYKNGSVSKFLIESTGSLIKTTPQYPENTTGFFFKNYEQIISKYNGDNGQEYED